ncbi:MAG: TolB family protein [Actinomycetota bacterium]
MVFVDPETGSITTVYATEADETNPEHSPDGTLIVYESGGQIHTVRADGSETHQLTDLEGEATQPTWSPDGMQNAGCDPGFFYTWQAVHGGALWTRTGVGATMRVWIVDVDGTRLFIEAATTHQASSSLDQEIQQIIGSLRFGSARVGFVDLPLDGATPSTPESGELVLSFYGSAEGIPRSKVFVYTDGRLIWQQEADLPSVRTSARPASSNNASRPRASSCCGPRSPRPEVFGDELDLATHGPLDATPGSALERLVPRLTDPASWLPASAWVDREINAYVPSRSEVCGYGRTQRIERILSQLPVPASGLRAGGCSDVTTEEARRLAEALIDAGPNRAGREVSTGRSTSGTRAVQVDLDSPSRSSRTSRTAR